MQRAAAATSDSSNSIQDAHAQNPTCKATKLYLSDFSCWSNFLDARFIPDWQLRSVVIADKVRLVLLGAVVALAEEAEMTKCFRYDYILGQEPSLRASGCF